MTGKAGGGAKRPEARVPYAWEAGALRSSAALFGPPFRPD